MQPAAERFLKLIGIEPSKVGDTALHDACHRFMTPCLATVGKCLEHHISPSGDAGTTRGDASQNDIHSTGLSLTSSEHGEVTVDADLCNCYAAAISHDITVSDIPGESTPRARVCAVFRCARIVGRAENAAPYPRLNPAPTHSSHSPLDS